MSDVIFDIIKKGQDTVLVSNRHKQIDVNTLNEKGRLENAGIDFGSGKSKYESMTGKELDEGRDAGMSEGTYARLFKTKDGKRVFVISGKYW